MSYLLFSCGINESNSSSETSLSLKKTCSVNFFQLDFYNPVIDVISLRLDCYYDCEVGYEFLIDVEKDKARPALYNSSVEEGMYTFGGFWFDYTMEEEVPNSFVITKNVFIFYTVIWLTDVL